MKTIVFLFLILSIQFAFGQIEDKNLVSTSNVTNKAASINKTLFINGKITAVSPVYADYVFDTYYKPYPCLNAGYKFQSLPEIEAFIKENKHLPGITPITALEKTGNGFVYNLTDLSIQNLEKTEELYLHIIEQQKQLEDKDKKIEALKKELDSETDTINQRLKKLEELANKKQR